MIIIYDDVDGNWSTKRSCIYCSFNACSLNHCVAELQLSLRGFSMGESRNSLFLKRRQSTLGLFIALNPGVTQLIQHSSEGVAI